MRCRSCPPLPEEVRRAADLLERRWTVSILYVSHEGAVRFNEFQQALGTIPPATLAQRLADLEEAGVFERAVIDDRPPRVEYRLTRRGRQLRSLVNALTRFAETGVGDPLVKADLDSRLFGSVERRRSTRRSR